MVLLVLDSVPSLQALVFPTLHFLKVVLKPKRDLKKKNKLLLFFEKHNYFPRSIKVENRLNNQNLVFMQRASYLLQILNILLQVISITEERVSSRIYS